MNSKIILLLLVAAPFTTARANDTLLDPIALRNFAGIKCTHFSSNPGGHGVFEATELKSRNERNDLGLPLFDLVITSGRAGVVGTPQLKAERVACFQVARDDARLVDCTGVLPGSQNPLHLVTHRTLRTGIDSFNAEVFQEDTMDLVADGSDSWTRFFNTRDCAAR